MPTPRNNEQLVSQPAVTATSTHLFGTKTAVQTSDLAEPKRENFSLVDRNAGWLLAAIVLLALAVRLVRLGETSLWIDEIWSIRIAGLPWKTFFWTVRNQDPNMSVYYALLHVWLLFGQSEFAARALSVAAGVATIPALYALGVRLFDRKVALIASALLAVNAFHVQWSQETRSYALLVLLMTLSYLYLTKSIERMSAKTGVLYVLTTSLALYAHIYAGLVCVAQAASLLFLGRRRPRWSSMFVLGVGVTMLSLPVVAFILERAKHPWMPLDWLVKPTVHGLYDKFYSFAGNANFPESTGGQLILAAYSILCLIAVISLVLLYRKSGSSVQTWGTMVALLWLLVPMAMALLISLVQPMFMNRYLLMTVPAMALLAAKGIRVIRPASLSVCSLIVVLSLGAARLPPYYQHRASFQEWKTVTQHVITHAQPGDGVIFVIAPGRLLFEYYGDKLYPGKLQSLAAIYPESRDMTTDPMALDYLPSFSINSLRSSLHGHPRVWFVKYHDFFATTTSLRDQMATMLAAEFPQVETVRYDGVTISLYSGRN
jgi:mannosyltransferase